MKPKINTYTDYDEFKSYILDDLKVHQDCWDTFEKYIDEEDKTVFNELELSRIDLILYMLDTNMLIKCQKDKTKTQIVKIYYFYELEDK